MHLRVLPQSYSESLPIFSDDQVKKESAFVKKEKNSLNPPRFGQIAQIEKSSDGKGMTKK